MFLLKGGNSAKCKLSIFCFVFFQNIYHIFIYDIHLIYCINPYSHLSVGFSDGASGSANEAGSH